MFKKLGQKIKNRKGFTLIELIVVIAILGILAAIAIPRLSGFSEKAKVSADQATFTTIDKAIAVGAADSTLSAGTVVATSSATGAITFTGTAGGTDAQTATKMATLVQSSPAFKKTSATTHMSLALTWTINADGSITQPTLP